MKVSATIAGLFVAAVLFTVNSPSVHAEAPNEQNQQVVTQQVKNEIEIKLGDTLSSIATAHQTTYVRLFDANAYIKDPDIIYPGDKVRIPAGEEQLASRAMPVEAPVAVAPPQARTTTSAASVRQRAVKPQAAQPRPVATASGDVWDRIAQCESGGNWSINTGNGYYGGLQFTPGSWRAAGGSGLPHQASREEQIERGKILQSKQGWGAWPACTRKLGLR